MRSISTLLLLLTTALSQKEGTRYIVKYKSGSKTYQEKLANAAKEQPYPSKNEGSVDTNLLLYGRFIPKANAEVVYFSSDVEAKEYEKMGDVEFIEQGTV